MELTKSIYSGIPVLIKEGPPEENPWGASFLRMFDMANDSHLFRSRGQMEADGWQLIGNIFHRDDDVYLPLYEAKMIWVLNDCFGTYEGGTAGELARGKLPELSPGQLDYSNFYPMPNNWVPSPEVKKACLCIPRWFLCFRKITNASVCRTFIGTIIPGVAAGDSLNFMLSSKAKASEILCLQANLSSFVEDYVMRQNIGGNNLNFFIAKQVPFLPPTSYSALCSWSYNDKLIDWISARALELSYTAWDLEPFAKYCASNAPPFLCTTSRPFLLRCELDAASFHLYATDRDDADYIMKTLPIFKTHDVTQSVDTRTTLPLF